MVTQGCGCVPNELGDIRCHNCGEYVNKKCWKCGAPRGGGRCPNTKILLIARAIEDCLVDFRDNRISVLNAANGLVVREPDGKRSDVIRLTTLETVRRVLQLSEEFDIVTRTVSSQLHSSDGVAGPPSFRGAKAFPSPPSPESHNPGLSPAAPDPDGEPGD